MEIKMSDFFLLTFFLLNIGLKQGQIIPSFDIMWLDIVDGRPAVTYVGEYTVTEMQTSKDYPTYGLCVVITFPGEQPCTGPGNQPQLCGGVKRPTNGLSRELRVWLLTSS